jgi:hypothetical protein
MHQDPTDFGVCDTLLINVQPQRSTSNGMINYVDINTDRGSTHTRAFRLHPLSGTTVECMPNR